MQTRRRSFSCVDEDMWWKALNISGSHGAEHLPAKRLPNLALFVYDTCPALLPTPLPHNRDLSTPSDSARKGCLNVMDGSPRSPRGQTVYEHTVRSRARPPLCQPLTPASISRNLLSFMFPCGLPRCSKASTRAQPILGKLRAGQMRDPSVLSTPGVRAPPCFSLRRVKA